MHIVKDKKTKTIDTTHLREFSVMLTKAFTKYASKPKSNKILERKKDRMETIEALEGELNTNPKARLSLFKSTNSTFFLTLLANKAEEDGFLIEEDENRVVFITPVKKRLAKVYKLHP